MKHLYPKRRRIYKSGSRRLKGYDYAKKGLYFVTIGCYNRECLLGKIVRETFIPSEFGQIAYNQWYQLPNRFSNVVLHEFQLMPNHLHGIIEINNEDQPMSKRITLSAILGAYKSLVANECLLLHKAKFSNQPCIPPLGKIWQRSFYDVIIRNHFAYKCISRYIRNNPKKWNRQ